MMKYIELPGTNLKVSRIAFGTWGLGGPPFWQAVDETEAINLLKEAHDNGINLFDTAPVYGLGHAETLLQKAFAKQKDVVIASKVGLRWKEETRRSIHADLSKKSITFEVEQSLNRLGRDVIDIYQVHLPDPATPLQETFETLSNIQKSGKIRYIGVSNYTVEMIMEAQKYVTIATCQPRFNYLDQKAAASLLPYCRNHTVGTLIYSPLASGLLTGKYGKESTFDDWRGDHYADLFAPSRRDKILTQIEKLKIFAENRTLPMTQMMLEWTLRQPAVSVALAGIRNKRHLPDALAAGELALDTAIFREF